MVTLFGEKVGCMYLTIKPNIIIYDLLANDLMISQQFYQYKNGI